MEPLVEVLRVVNWFSQVQVTSVVTYSGWMSFFMVSSRVTAAGSHPNGYVNRSQRPSVPSPTAWGRIDLDACSTLWRAGLFLVRRPAARPITGLPLEGQPERGRGALALPRGQSEGAVVV